jgi:L,D-transpeptidase catalytic domain
VNRRLAACIGIAAALAAVAVIGASASSAATLSSAAPELALRWSAPTPANGKAFVVEVGSTLRVRLAASRGAVITARGLPRGAALTTGPGGLTLTWTPTVAGIGPHAVVLAARRPGTQLFTPPRTLFLYGLPAAAAPAPPAAERPEPTTPLASPGVSRWTYLVRRASVRAQPSTSARVVTRLATRTLDSTPNLVLLLASTKDSSGRTWYRVRLPILPNNSTGWVLAGALGTQHIVKTYLVVDRQLLMATLYRSGVPVFQTRIGAGRPYWPTPAGDFYVREVLTGFEDEMYGPIAFGTSARSSVLTDWHGGGGVIGIHGTDQPEILPGHVSHGCIRMRNSSIRRLYRLMPLGTPVTIR